MKLLRLFILATLIAGLCLVTSCRSTGPTVGPLEKTEFCKHLTGKRGGSLSYRIASPPKTFNYLVALDEPTLIVSFYLMGGRLVEFDHGTRRYVPGLAERWELSGDGRTMDLVLRQGLKFSDGHPLTAEDVRFTFHLLYDPRTASPIFGPGMTIGGCQIGVSVVDSTHLRLVFPEPVAVPESYLSNLAVLPSHVLQHDFDQGKFREAYSMGTDPGQIVTAGPFVPRTVTPGERVVLARNPHYWKKDSAGAPLPYLDELVIEVASDANNAFARLTQGGLDIYDRIRPVDYVELSKHPAMVRAFDMGPGLNTDYFWFNLNSGEREGKPIVNPIKQAWFGDPRFRRAVSYAIDRETISTATLQGLATPLYGFISPSNRQWVAEDLPRTAYDIEKARELLHQSGFTQRGATDRPELYDSRGNRVELTMIVPAENQLRTQMAAVVQENLARLGVKINIAPIESGEVSRRISQSYDYDAALLGAFVSEPDPSSYTNLLSSSSPSQQWHPRQARPATEWESRLDQLLVAQAREANFDRRRTVFHEIQTILADQLPVIPLAARHLLFAANGRTGNYCPSTLTPYSLWNAEELFVR